MQNLDLSSLSPSLSLLLCRSCIIGPELSVKVCSIGTVINRSAYASDYCQLEGTTGRQTQPMPIRWMAWESVLLVSHFNLPSLLRLQLLRPACSTAASLSFALLFYALRFTLLVLCVQAQVYNYKLMSTVHGDPPVPLYLFGPLRLVSVLPFFLVDAGRQLDSKMSCNCVNYF